MALPVDDGQARMGDRPRVLFVCASGGRGRLQRGGAERFLVEVLPRLSERFEVHALLSDPDLAATLEADGVAVHRAGPSSRVDLSYVKAIRNVVKRTAPHVVSLHLLSSAMHGRVALAGGKARRLVTLHNSLLQYVHTAAASERITSRQNLLLDRILRVLVPHDSVAVSRFEYEELRRLRPARPVHLIPNGLPAAWDRLGAPSREDARARLGLEQDAHYVLYMGRLEYEKGADRLEDIAGALQGRATLLVVGDGVIKPQRRGILLVPRTDDPNEYYDAADVVVMPSRVEAFGRVALEAVSRGVPVVHTGAGGLSDLLAETEGILSFERQFEGGAFAEAVLLALETGRSNLSARAALAQSYLEKYSFGQMLTSWADLLHRLARSGLK